MFRNDMTPLEESPYEVQIYTPELHAEFREVMFGVLILKETLSVKHIVADMLTFTSPSDRCLMKKYQQMENYLGHIHRYKTAHSKDKKKLELMDYLIRLINLQSRRIPIETLEKYDRTLEMVANFYPKDVENPFEIYGLRLHTVVFKPLANHTFQRTFKPKLDYFFGVDIKVPIKYRLNKYRDNDVEDPNEIPHALQGEIADLNRKFKVSLDPAGKNKSIRLMCYLEDDLLPCVPPIYIDIPEKYPFCSPKCIIMQEDYSTTPFLATIQNILTGCIFKLPKCFSVTHILNTWEMSIRRACNPDKIYGDSFNMVYEIFSQECSI